jgi:hypothetical protein
VKGKTKNKEQSCQKNDGNRDSTYRVLDSCDLPRVSLVHRPVEWIARMGFLRFRVVARDQYQCRMKSYIVRKNWFGLSR